MSLPAAVKFARYISLFIITLFVFSPAAHASSWSVTRLDGDVRMRVDDAAQWQRLKQGQSITPPFHLHTGTTGRATLSRSGDVLYVSTHTELFFPAREENQSSLFTRILQNLGVTQYRVKPRPNPEFEVVTPHLVSTVKGTYFDVSVSTEKSSVSLIEGLLQVEGRKINSKILLTPGQTAILREEQGSIELLSLGYPSEGNSLTGTQASSDLNDITRFSWGEALTKSVRDRVAQTSSSTAYHSELSGTQVLHDPLVSIAPGTENAGLVMVDGPVSQVSGIDAVGSTLGNLGDTVGGSVGSLGGTVGSALGNLGDTVGGSIGSLGDTVGGSIGSLGDTVGGSIGSLGGTVGGTVGSLGGTVDSALGSLGDTVTPPVLSDPVIPSLDPVVIDPVVVDPVVLDPVVVDPVTVIPEPPPVSLPVFP